MHAYATDAPDREMVPKVLALLAVAAAVALNAALPMAGVRVPWWLDAPSVMGFYSVFAYAFDRWGWRLQLGSLRLSAVPDLEGTWSGVVESSYGGGTSTPVVLHVRQTWTKLCIQLESAGSRSSSTMAALNVLGPVGGELCYEYLNEPATFSAETMQAHRGAAQLRLSPDRRVLMGDYYTGRGRRNIGIVTFRRISAHFLPRRDALAHAGAGAAIGAQQQHSER